MKRLAPGFLFLCFAVFLASSAFAATMIRSDAAWYRVHLGTGVDQPVTAEEVAAFIDTVIAERFPEGLTIMEARGQWNSKEHGLLRERTTVVDVQCPDTEDNFTKIREIADLYIKQFTRAKASCFVKRIPGVNTILYYQ